MHGRVKTQSSCRETSGIHKYGKIMLNILKNSWCINLGLHEISWKNVKEIFVHVKMK